MDPAEALFKRALGLWKRMRGSPPLRLGAHAVELADHQRRFEALAAMLAGEPLALRPADDLGGVSGAVLLLPPHLALFDRQALNEALYVQRIVHDCTLRALGLQRAFPGGSLELQLLTTSLAAKRVLDRLRAEYSGAEPEARALRAAVRGLRPAQPADSVAGVLEALICSLLGDDAAALALSPPARAWLEAALACGAGSAAELASEAQRMQRELSRLALSNKPRLPAPVPLFGLVLPQPEEGASEAVEALPDPSRDGRQVVQLARTLRLERKALGKREDRPLYHVFEKIETAEEFGGQSATPDASGDVRQMEDVMNDLSLATVVRTREAPRNLVRAEVIVEPTSFEVRDTSAESDASAFKYPEWDFKRAEYRADFCTVFEERLVPGADDESDLVLARGILRRQRRHVDDIRMHLLRSLYKRTVRNRQMEGPEIDVEAMVERHADLMAGQTPPERLYLSARKSIRELAILVLLDASFSTDAWVEGRRVLDIEVESLLVLSAAFAGHLEREVAVASFQSNTRKDVRVRMVKGFDDSWRHLQRVAPRVVPGGYTRIGAALRHATALLDATHARHKLLLLVSDGKPTDYDRYEGRYGVEDVAHAVREAAQKRVRTFGLAIGKSVNLSLARMFGADGYRILPRISLLPDAMAEVFTRLLTS